MLLRRLPQNLHHPVHELIPAHDMAGDERIARGVDVGHCPAGEIKGGGAEAADIARRIV